MIKGIHHIAMYCATKEDEARVRSFYLDTLGMSIRREWAGGFMIDTGNGILEIFTGREGAHEKGIYGHLAFLTDDVDELVEKVKAAGYNVFMGPRDAVIASTPEYPIRMAFCNGPLGEEIELFCER